MDKNVSGVDLEELKKAREALDKERGVETDPNLYSDYNPNREEQIENTSIDSENSSNYDNITNDNEGELSDNEIIEPNNESSNEEELDLMEEMKNNEEAEIDIYADKAFENQDESQEGAERNTIENSESEENISKFDIFAAFEVKENAPEKQDEIIEEPSVNDDNTSNESDETLSDKLSSENNHVEDDLDKKLEKIDNAEELENLLSDLLIELDDEEEEITDKLESVLSESEPDEDEAMLNEMLGKVSAEEDQQTSETTDNSLENEEGLTGIDIEPKLDGVKVTFDDEQPENDGLTDETSDDVAENVHSVGNNPLEDLTVVDFTKKEETDDEIKSNVSDDLDDEEDDEINLYENNENEVVSAEKEKAPDLVESVEDEGDFVKNEQEQESENLVSDELDITNNEGEFEDKESSNEDDLKDSVENISNEETETNDYILSLTQDNIDGLLGKKEEPVYEKEKKPMHVLENSVSERGTEIITDYSQLKDIFQQQLGEDEETETDEFKKKFNYKNIDEFKFIDEIVTDGFKQADKFSYILGRNEKNEMIYANFKDHSNLAIFGKNDSVTNSLLNSMILSLCLKNSYQDVNFVLLDSDINSSFEVYNKSSYLYFNRIAKTNKEILDTLIEVSKEVDARYDKFARLGVKNIEGYNEIVVDNNLEPMPQVVLVFNNYTSAAQATNHDRINACLYQILKFGRIAGIYVVVAAKLPIDVNQINYSLSSRVSFKSDEDSRFTVGDEGVEYLPNENDAIFYNIATNRSQHIKTATVSDIELELIIKDLEE